VVHLTTCRCIEYEDRTEERDHSDIGFNDSHIRVCPIVQHMCRWKCRHLQWQAPTPSLIAESTQLS
jgi:hypothetical protein